MVYLTSPITSRLSYPITASLKSAAPGGLNSPPFVWMYKSMDRIKPLKCAVFVYWNEVIKWLGKDRPYLLLMKTIDFLPRFYKWHCFWLLLTNLLRVLIKLAADEQVWEIITSLSPHLLASYFAVLHNERGSRRDTRKAISLSAKLTLKFVLISSSMHNDFFPPWVYSDGWSHC